MSPLSALRPSLYAAAAIGALLLANSVAPQPDPQPRAATAAISAAMPSVTTVEPGSGALTGGETMTISGSGLTSVTAVEVAGMPADITSSTNGSLTVVAPNSPDYRAETVDVALFVGDDEVPSDLSWTYEVRTAVDRQLQYAFDHWDNYNLAYFGDFNVWGGDCMNFVSQTLLARGWTATDDWFNDAQQEWAPAFVHVPSFDEWLAGHPEYGAVRLSSDQSDEVKVGDLVTFDWDGDGSLDHIQIVSRVTADDGGPIIQMVGHNLDSTYRSVDDALGQLGTASARVSFWSIPL